MTITDQNQIIREQVEKLKNGLDNLESEFRAKNEQLMRDVVEEATKMQSNGNGPPQQNMMQ